MRKGKSIVNKPILSLEDGTYLREVKDLILGPENDAIVGLLVDEGGLLSASKVVPTDQITSFGRDAVVVQSHASVVAATEAPRINQILDRKQSLVGTKVFTESGDDQGKVTDIYFDEETGRVVGMEVSGGRLTDVTHGLRYLPVDEVVRIGPEILYVKPETGEALEGQRGGVTGALADAGDRTRDAASEAGDRAGAAASKARDRAGAAAGDARDRAASASPEDRLVGKRTGRDVEDETGAVIVPAGRRITPDDVERARSAGRLQALTAAATAGEAGAAADAGADTLGNAGDTAASLWDQFLGKLSEVTDSTGRRVDEEQTKRRLKQIEDAVGRPVTKVILDLDDRVILDLGDVITHTAVQRAHEAGALDSLLDSVYRGDVTFSKDEMRARRPGEANLEAAQESDTRPAVVEELRTKVETAEREREQEAERKRREGEADRQAREAERDARRETRGSKDRAKDAKPEPVAVGPGSPEGSG